MPNDQHTVELAGCAPIPLAHYLKALGILRLVSEQVDPDARGWWENDTFWLRSTLDREGLVKFFLERYCPTPIVVPWSGADFFSVNRKPDPTAFTEQWPAKASEPRPTAATIIESFLVTLTRRLEFYRQTLSTVFRATDAAGLREKNDLDKKGCKRCLLLAIRALADDQLIPWIDAAAILGSSDKPEFNNLLGGGGGSDGNSHFSDNFMQCLWCVLPDFDFQRKKPTVAVGGFFESTKAIRNSLFGHSSRESLLVKLSPALFNSQALGGVNATAGFSAQAASNPWDYILMIEGVLLFAGTLSRKVGSATPADAMFPFVFRLSPVGLGALVQGEATARGKEAWLPLWPRATSLAETSSLFAESRVLVGKRHASNGLDVVRSLASLGIDRGVCEFQRIGLIRGRIGGDNYFTSADLGRFRPERNQAVDILEDVDRWLDRFRRAATSQNAPARAGRALRRLETAILELCQRGESQQVQDVLIAMGQAEAAVAISPKLRDPKEQKNKVDPVPPLSVQWLTEAYMGRGDREFRLAAALASIGYGESEKVGPFRQHIEPIDPNTWNSRWPKWNKTAADPNIVWGGGNLVQNMIAVLNRRMIEAVRNGKQSGDAELLFPGDGRYCAPLGDVAAFINGEVDDERIESLLRGLMLINWRYVRGDILKQFRGPREPMPDAAYALLKLCHLPHAIADKAVPLTPSITRRAAAGQITEATRLAARRLRGSRLAPAVDVIQGHGQRARRTAAAILFPIWSGEPIMRTDVGQLMRLVLPLDSKSTPNKDTTDAADNPPAVV